MQRQKCFFWYQKLLLTVDEITSGPYTNSIEHIERKQQADNKINIILLKHAIDRFVIYHATLRTLILFVVYFIIGIVFTID